MPDPGRPRSEALEELLGVQLDVLDDGFVRVVDYMGNDSSIVQAARVSYGEGTKRVSEDEALIRYLLRHRHTTPFEMCEIKLHVRTPMDCWRQWIRHRTANVNEYSTRYSIAIDAMQKTGPAEWRMQSSSNRQGSEGQIAEEAGLALTAGESELHQRAREVYEERLAGGVAREQARKDLPLSTYTEAYWKIDLHNLLHFLSLRMESAAQAEIRAYAKVIGEKIVAAWCPVVWKAFLDYRASSVFLTRLEAGVLAMACEGAPEDDVFLYLQSEGLAVERKKGWALTKEGSELATKLERFGVHVPTKPA